MMTEDEEETASSSSSAESSFISSSCVMGSRKEFFMKSFLKTVGTAALILSTATAAETMTSSKTRRTAVANAAMVVDEQDDNKKLGLSDEQVKEIVKSDILDRQFLVTGQLTRSIYNPKATFTDEIDTYEMNQWMTGTQKLFVGEKSQVRLVGDVDVDSTQIVFRFDEDLMFRIPFNPIVSLTGKVILSRDEKTGYITSYQEYWDQDVISVLKTAKF